MVSFEKTFMKHALVIAELPQSKTRDEGQTIWLGFLEYVRRIGEHPKETIQLAENVWQIPLDNGLIFLGKMLELAETNQIPMRVLFLDELPAWIKHPPV